jgi:hypothetical protein
MPKPLDIPMQVAKAFVRDMHAYFAEPNAIKRDFIAGRQLQALRQYTPRYGRKLPITDILEMFQEMKEIRSRLAPTEGQMAVLTPEQIDEGVRRLALYWNRARLMHHLLHQVKDAYDGDLYAIRAEKGLAWVEFETFLLYWLAALFVCVEGFNKLRLNDPKVRKLFSAHVNDLKHLRHEVYHFTIDVDF